MPVAGSAAEAIPIDAAGRIAVRAAIVKSFIASIFPGHVPFNEEAFRRLLAGDDVIAIAREEALWAL